MGAKMKIMKSANALHAPLSGCEAGPSIACLVIEKLLLIFQFFNWNAVNCGMMSIPALTMSDSNEV